MAGNENNRILQLSELTQGKHHFSFTLSDEYFRAAEKSEIIGGNVSIEADLVLYESTYSLHLTAHGTVQLICDRCLAPMNYNVDIDDNILPEEDDNVNSDTIDLDWLAYEQITINLPLVHSHPEGECMQDMQLLLQSHLCSTVEPE